MRDQVNHLLQGVGKEATLEKLTKLVDYMHYGCAMIVYMRQSEEICITRGTLVYYSSTFGRNYDMKRALRSVVYWDIEKQGWRNFKAENLIDWRPAAL